MRDKRVPMKEEERPLVHVHLSKQATTLCDKPFNASTWLRDERSYESSAVVIAHKDLVSCPECLKRVRLKPDALPSEIGVSPVELTSSFTPQTPLPIPLSSG